MFRYPKSEVEVQLGDYVKGKSFGVFPIEGRVCYLPGVSPKHGEIDFNGTEQVVIETTTKKCIAIGAFRSTGTIGGNFRFIRRADDDFEGIMPDEEIL